VSTASVASRAHLGEDRGSRVPSGGVLEKSEAARLEVLHLFRENGQAVYRLALVLVRHHQDAEDVVQETFLKLMRHLEKGGGTQNLRGWLFTVAAHACRDRGRFRLRWVPWSPAHERSAPPAADPVEEDERTRVARAGIDRLPKRDRLLLTLRAQGLSYRDIAAAAGVQPASVGQLLSRALARWERACAGAALPLESKDKGRTTS
jgi:RNA polymerase sigma-70 factor, ECF subfamily